MGGVGSAGAFPADNGVSMGKRRVVARQVRCVGGFSYWLSIM